MDILKAEIARKRKQLEDKNLVDSEKKYFKRGDLREKEKEEYANKYLQTQLSSQSASSDHCEASSSLSRNPDLMNLPRSEVIRKLRERGEPILLYGESERDACARLRTLEISAPEVNRGFRNDFQEAMEEVDAAYLHEILDDETAASNSKDKNKKDDLEVDEWVTYEALKERSRTLGRNKTNDIVTMLNLLKFLLRTWNDQLTSISMEEKLRTKMKIQRATFTQTRVYLKPLLKKLKNDKIPEDIFDSLIEIVKHLLEGNYIKASDAYLTMAIGNAPWPIGVTMVGIHARTGREKIFSKNVAHVLNDESQRKYIQALKRLMTKCQEFFPSDPSRSVEYVSHKDQ